MNTLHHDNDERAPNEHPVAAIAPQYLTIATGKGTASLPLYATGEWRARGTRVRRALIVIHGRLRNADAYFNLAHHALAQAGETANDTLLIVPQFVARDDVDAHGLQANTLFWEWTSWMGGDDATGPVPLSSFDVLDTLLEALADTADYPDLEQVVIAGHSGGAQVVQRYAAVSHGDRALAARGIRTRYVVANPSTYLYFDAQRPMRDGSFAPLDTQTGTGAQANAWKYGLDNLPAYVERQHGASGTRDIERDYVARDVVVLLGERDCDPRHPALDRSVGALAQGEHRLERGLAYSRYILERHPGNTNHRTLTIPGVGHDPKGIFGSAPGLKALFNFEGHACARTDQG